MASWTILTCEYPPCCGGVGDYTSQVAGALAAAGDDVVVFAPRSGQPGVPAGGSGNPLQAGVTVEELADAYGRRSRSALDRWLEKRRSTLLVQYVPTAFGMRGANLPWCRWLERQATRGNEVRVMFHEPYFEFAWMPVHRNVLAAVQRLMARTLMRAATQTYVSTDAWRPYLAPYSPYRNPDRFITLPIPSAIPACDRPAQVGERRRALIGSHAGQLVGHFGTYGTHVAPLLRSVLVSLLLEDPTLAAVCAGAGSDAFASALMAAHPRLQGRIHAIGRAPAQETAVVLSACDLLLQPYFDGVTTRRTSVMAGLANGRAVLTTTGHLTEPLWAESRAVALQPASDIGAFLRAARDLLADDDLRASLASRGERLYRERFALVHTIAALRGAAQGRAA